MSPRDTLNSAAKKATSALKNILPKPRSQSAEVDWSRIDAALACNEVQMQWVRRLREEFKDLDEPPTLRDAGVDRETMENFIQMTLMEKLQEDFERLDFSPWQRMIMVTSLSDDSLRQLGYE